MMILKNCTFFNEAFEKEFGDIEIQDGIITRIGILGGDGADKSGGILIPGLVDIHIHGAGGGDTCDASEASLAAIAGYLAKHGVTSYCPTAMTMPQERLRDIVTAVKNDRSGGAKAVGINLEGPYISKEKKGSQNPEYVRAGSLAEFDELYDLSGGKIKLITVAPEAFDSDGFIRGASQRCTVAIGHTNATAAQCTHAIDSGARHVTHLFNAMTPMRHREAGVVGTALDDSRVTCELICDLHHISPAVLRSAFRILGEDRAVAVSDSMRAAGLGAGAYDLGGQTVTVAENGTVAALPDGTIGASITNLHEELKNLVSIGIDFKTALKACTINPARVIGEEARIGSIAVGKAADLVLLDENLNIQEVYINGILAEHCAH